MKQETLEEAANIERLAMDKLKNKWEHLYTFGYPQRPFPTNYENDLNNIKIGLHEGAKWQAERMYTLEQISKDFIGEEGQSGYFDDWLDYRLDSKNKLSFREWFEQFKKDKL
jgi:hypothetical protein